MTQMTPMDKCIVCNDNYFLPRYNNTLKQCRTCSFVTTNFDVDEAELKRIYSANYFKGEEYLDYVMEKGCLQKNFAQRLNSIQKIIPNANITSALEIGCAYGFFAEVFHQYYPAANYIGVDVVEEAIRYGQDVLHLNLKLADFLNMDLAKSSFSDVFLWDVIEHLKEPHLFLDKISTCLQPSGRLYITTGDIGALLPRITKQKWRLIHPPTHIHYFSRKTLSQLLTRYEFMPINVSYPLIYRSARQIFYFLFLLNKKSPTILAKIHNIIPTSLFIPMNTFDIMFLMAIKM
jgi:2-polyprenyl-3-methyl-5-hydroxy-6-metoxy-1,4-benzoquinol methylase